MPVVTKQRVGKQKKATALKLAWPSGDGIRINIYGRSGTGKCLGAGTPVLMYDGSITPVEDVEEGDLLMGPDSKPRQVTSISQGRGTLYRVIPQLGDSWICNADHVLTLVGGGHKYGEIRDVNVADYLAEQQNKTPHYRSWKLWRTGVEFRAQSPVGLPPYLIGLLLGDGARRDGRITNRQPAIHRQCRKIAHQLGMRCVIKPAKGRNTASISFVGKDCRYGDGKNPMRNYWRKFCLVGQLKRIPQECLTASRVERLQLLAGIVDTDGGGGNPSKGDLSVGVTGEVYRDTLLQLARGLGFTANSNAGKRYVCKNGRVSHYFKVHISGDLSQIPSHYRKLPPRQTPKRHNVTGFTLKKLPAGDYYGFTLDGDGRFLLGDHTVTHNTTLWATFPGPILAIICSGGKEPGELRSIDTQEYREKIHPIAICESLQLGSLIAGASDYATIVLDHATGLQDLILKEILGLAELPVQKNWKMASREQYGQCALQTKEWLRSVLSFDGNVVIVAQEREFNTDSEEGLLMPYVASALTPSVVGWLNPAVDYICETFIRQRITTVKVKIGKRAVKISKLAKGVDYCLRTAPDPVYVTKFRIPKGRLLPDVVVDPTYDKIWNLIQGKEI